MQEKGKDRALGKYTRFEVRLGPRAGEGHCTDTASEVARAPNSVVYGKQGTQCCRSVPPTMFNFGF